MREKVYGDPKYRKIFGDTIIVNDGKFSGTLKLNGTYQEFDSRVAAMILRKIKHQDGGKASPQLIAAEAKTIEKPESHTVESEWDRLFKSR